MSIKAADIALVRELVAHYCNRMLAGLAGAPPAVRADLETHFVIFLAEVTDNNVAELQRELPAPLPSLFAAYLRCGAFSGVEWADYALPPMRTGEGLATVSQYMLDDSARSLWRCGYMQFASGPCGDPVCFDIQQAGPPGEYPVVVFNHDMIPQADWNARESLARHARPVAASFEEFLTFLCTGTDRDGRRH